MENQILIALKNNKLLKNILFTELNLSALKGNLLTLSEGEILYREEEPSEYLYLVVSGEINVLRKKGSNRNLSEIYTDHDFFGSDEFIENSRRKSTAVALRDSYIIALTKEEVDALIEQNDEILTNLYESLQQAEPEDKEELIAPDIEEINFKKTRKVETNFAKKIFDQAKKPEQEAEEVQDCSEINETDEDSDEGQTKPKSFTINRLSGATKEKDSPVKKDFLDDQIEGVPVDKIKSFNKIESRQKSSDEKSFLEKLKLVTENKNKPGIESSATETEENKITDKPEDKLLAHEEHKPVEESIPEKTPPPPGDRFPTAFEIKVSYSDGTEDNESNSTSADQKVETSDESPEDADFNKFKAPRFVTFGSGDDFKKAADEPDEITEDLENNWLELSDIETPGVDEKKDENLNEPEKASNDFVKSWSATSGMDPEEPLKDDLDKSEITSEESEGNLSRFSKMETSDLKNDENDSNDTPEEMGTPQENDINFYVSKLDIKKRDKISLSDFSFPEEETGEEEKLLTGNSSDSNELEEFYASLGNTSDNMEMPETLANEEETNWLDSVNFSGSEAPAEEPDQQPEEIKDDQFTGFSISSGYNPEINYVGEELDKTEEKETEEFAAAEQWTPPSTEKDSFNPDEELNMENDDTSIREFDSPEAELPQEEIINDRPVTETEVNSEISQPNFETDASLNNEIQVKSPKDYSEIEQSIDMLEKINRAAQIVNSNIKIDDVFKSIVDVASDLTHADRGTLYLVDRVKNELWSKIALGNEFREIKLSVGEGIAGWVAQKGEIINLENVQEDPRFNVAFDKSSGYITKNMLCFPIRNKSDEIVGVLQLINSKNGKFGKLDEEFLSALSLHASMAIQNADLVEQLLTGERVASLGKMANFLIQDIKKPIMVSKRYAEHLKSKVLEQDVGRVVDMLLDQLNHIADLVQSTSSYSEGQIVLRSILCKLNETLDDYLTRIDSVVRGLNCQIVKEYDKEINSPSDIRKIPSSI